ncbi:hypothetical protein DFP96_11918 [Listeria rocourtiae]|uniref:Uncharacterized protein n=1 Tax=Listeria rocourtiae TaxID=647910 RepID=A0A4R6ZER7_9LIST|nr:hypothetical protein DFP96_11918 [Listeria rocourtiae]
MTCLYAYWRRNSCCSVFCGKMLLCFGVRPVQTPAEGLHVRVAHMHIGGVIHFVQTPPTIRPRTYQFSVHSLSFKKINPAIINLSTKQKGVNDVKKGIFGLMSAVLIMLLVGTQTQPIIVPLKTTELHTTIPAESSTAQIIDIKN